MDREGRRRAAVVVAAAGTVTAAIVGLGLDVASAAAAGTSVPLEDAMLLFGWLSLPVVGAVVLWNRSRQPIGRLLVGMGLAGAVQLLSHAWAVWALRTHPGEPGGTFAAGLASWTSIPAIGALAFLPALLPDGRPTGRRMRAATAIAVGAIALLAAAQALAPERLDGVPRGVRAIPNPLGVEALAGVTAAASTASVLVLVAFAATSVVDLVRRSRAAQGEARQQLRWLTTACAVLPVAVVGAIALDTLGLRQASELVLAAGQVGFLVGLAAALGVAVLRYRLYDLDLMLRRSFVLAALTTCLAAVYIGTVAFVGYAIAPDGGVAAVLATVVVAAAVQPVRRTVQAWVERLVLRGRREPYAVLTALGDRLEQARAPEDALHEVLETLARELQRPSVRLELRGDASAETAQPTQEERFPVAHHGVVLGELVVGLRRPGERLDPADRQLLGELARQAAALVDAVRMERALERSREQLLRERDVERDRLRRDLHDGLGPTLAGLTLRVDVASDGVAPATPAGEQLGAVRAGLQGAVEEVRRIVEDLRPPDLDAHGLVTALRQRFEGLPSAGASAVGPLISVEAHALEQLPTAVELALYRIASEAVTNVLRHADARSCRVVLANAVGGVSLDVIDDGLGLHPQRQPGIGLHSMRERAIALGGSCEVGPAPVGGTRVHVFVPVTP